MCCNIVKMKVQLVVYGEERKKEEEGKGKEKRERGIARDGITFA